MLLISMALIACLHLVILPSASGGYNDECFMPDDKRRILRIMVQNISKAASTNMAFSIGLIMVSFLLLVDLSQV